MEAAAWKNVRWEFIVMAMPIRELERELIKADYLQWVSPAGEMISSDCTIWSRLKLKLMKIFFFFYL